MEHHDHNSNLPTHHTKRVHHLLAHSYSFYFFLFLCGVLLDLAFPTSFFHGTALRSVGFLLLILSSALIFWAQTTSRNLEKKNLTVNTFRKGPYYFTRSPTHWGLFLLMLGFGIISNAAFVILFTVISFFITKFIFLVQEEKMLAERFGEPYLEYKKVVRF